MFFLVRSFGFVCVFFFNFLSNEGQKSSGFSLADKRLYKQLKKVSEEVSSSTLNTLTPKYH